MDAVFLHVDTPHTRLKPKSDEFMFGNVALVSDGTMFEVPPFQ